MVQKSKNTLSKYIILALALFSAVNGVFVNPTKVNAQPPGRECAVELIVVLDCSGSMGGWGGATLVAVRQAADDFVTNLMGGGNPQQHRVGVVWYSSSASLRQGLTFNEADVHTAIDTNPGMCGGVTQMDDAINMARTELTTNGEPGVPTAIVHLTDGNPCCGATDVADATAAFNAAKAAGIRIFNIGLGGGVNDAYLSANASANCPNAPAAYRPQCYWKAPTPADLDTIYQEILVALDDVDMDGYIDQLCGGPDEDDNNSCVNPLAPEGMICGRCPLTKAAGGHFTICDTKYYPETNVCAVNCNDNADNDQDDDIDRADEDCPKEGGLVPCGRATDDPTTMIKETNSCTICHIFVSGKRIIDFLVESVAFPLLVLMILVGGFFLLTAAGSVSRVSQGKSIITTAIIAIVLLLAFWVIINTVIFFLTGQEQAGIATILGQPWNEIPCPVCGDGECEPGETFAGCPEDCMTFLWVPLSGINELDQIDMKTCEVVNTYTPAMGIGVDPSRLTVMRGGDVWTANRGGSINKLSPDWDNLPSYNVSGPFGVGAGPRAITYDTEGYIWVGNNGSMSEIDPTTGNPTGRSVTIAAGAVYSTYGAIGDPFGNIWIANREQSEFDWFNVYDPLLTLNRRSVLGVSGVAPQTVYGIGMDNEGDIWLVADNANGYFIEIAGDGNPSYPTGTIIDKSGAAGLQGCQTGSAAGSRARGIAVDGNNIVWVAASGDGRVFAYNPDCSGPVCNINTGLSPDGTGPIGVAIDQDNNAWIVAQGGRVFEYGAVGGPNQCNLLCDLPVGDSPYNYSDMTGFRTVSCPLQK